MASLLLLASGLPVVSCFADFADGESDIQTRVHGAYDTITSTYNLPADSAVYVYARSVEFAEEQGGGFGGGVGSDFPQTSFSYWVVPVRIDFRLVNNSDSFYKISGFSFDIHNYNSSAFINLYNYDFGGLTVASITRPSDLANQVQRWSMIPDGGFLSLAPGQSVYYSGYIYYAIPVDLYGSQIVQQFQVISLTGAVMDAVDNNQGATAGGQQEIIDNIQDQYDTDSGQQDAITGDVNTAVDDIGNIGIFSFLIDFSKQLVGVFSSGSDSTSLTLPGFSITVDGEQHTVWEAQVYDLSSLEGPFAVLLAAMRLGTSVVVIGALISYLFGLYEHIFAGSEEY